MISSPGDVEAERAEVEEAIKELNEKALGELGIRLEPIRWENNCYPSVGADSQAVINEELGDDYNIFIGIFWRKYGTPTPRAQSGTIDEFERAYARWSQTRISPQIMFYFRDGPTSLGEVDEDQLILIRNFRKRLKPMGVLFWPYKDEEDFGRLIRMHLFLAVTRLRINQGSERAVNPCISSTTESGIDENNEGTEDGFLDLVEGGEEAFQDLNEIVGRMSELITVLGDKIQERCTEYTSGQKDRKKLRQFSDSTADDLKNFTSRLNVETPQYARLYSKGIDKYARALTISTDFNGTNEQDLTNLLNHITRMRTATETARESVNKFRDTIAITPRLTTTFVKARNHAVAAVDTLLSEMRTAINLTLDMEKVIEETIQNLKNRKVEICLAESSGADRTI